MTRPAADRDRAPKWSDTERSDKARPGGGRHGRVVDDPSTEPPTEPLALPVPEPGPVRGHAEPDREADPASEPVRAPGPGHDVGQGHGHGHGHGPAAPAGRRVRVLLAALLVPCALAALVGLVLLSPTGGPSPAPGTALLQPVRGQVTAAQATDCSPGDGQGRCAALVVAMTDGPRSGRDLVQLVPLEPGTPRFTVGDPVVLGWSGGNPDDPARTRSPPPSSRPPTPAAPSRAGTSPTSRPTFAVTLIVDDDLTAISNGGRSSRRLDLGNGKRQVEFADTMRDVDLPGRVHRRPVRAHRARVDVDGVPLRVVHVARQGAPHRLRPGDRARTRCGSSPPTSASRTRATSSTSSPSPTSPSAPWRTSGAVTFRETALLVDPEHGSPRRARAGGRRRRPRDRPHVVRRPGDDEVVERHLAQRGVRHVHGADVRRRLPARVGAVGAASASSRDAAMQRRRPVAPPGRSSSPSAAPEEAEGMFDVLTYQKGCGRPAHARAATSAPSRSAQGIVLYLAEAQLRQHRDHRPVGRHRGGDGRAGARA